MPANDIKNYWTFICRFEFRKCGNEGKQLQKFKFLENKKSFLDKIKSIFHSFWRGIIWWKKKTKKQKKTGTSATERPHRWIMSEYQHG